MGEGTDPAGTRLEWLPFKAGIHPAPKQSQHLPQTPGDLPLPPMHPILVQPKACGAPSPAAASNSSAGQPWMEQTLRLREPGAWTPLEASARPIHLCQRWAYPPRICPVAFPSPFFLYNTLWPQFLHSTKLPGNCVLALYHACPTTVARGYSHVQGDPTCSGTDPRTTCPHVRSLGCTPGWQQRGTHRRLSHAGVQGCRQATHPGQGDRALPPCKWSKVVVGP